MECKTNTSKQAKTVRVSLQALINKFSIKNNHAATKPENKKNKKQFSTKKTTCINKQQTIPTKINTKKKFCHA